MRSRHVAVLGAGIMGCATALQLARRGHRVMLFDQQPAPFCGASRWNEGKIHLGFIYSADPSLETARKVIPGGLLFRPCIEQLLETNIAVAVTQEPDLVLCHRDSVVPPEAMQAYFYNLMQLTMAHPDVRHYLADISGEGVQRLSESQLRDVSGSAEIVAGFRVPERSVSTNWIADLFVAAIAADPHIEICMDTKVTAIESHSAPGHDGPWQVRCKTAKHGPFDFVVNALWQGRIAIDTGVGISPTRIWSNRFRLAAFVRTSRSVQVPSTIIATGPFGDVKNYNGRDFYASWYPLGLLADTRDVDPEPPALPKPEDARKLSMKMLDRLTSLVPHVRQIKDSIETIRLAGGWVHAVGSGALSDPHSTLHRRTEFGILQSGTYISVDTGKYSTAPWLAHLVAESVR